MDLNRGAATSAAEPPTAQAHDAWSLASPASLFVRPQPRAQVIFKKRRWSSLPAAAIETTEPGASADNGSPRTESEGSRPPRVFTTKRIEQALQAHPASPAAEAPIESNPPLRVRRRRPAEHSPGKVIRVVPGQTAGAMIDSPASTAGLPDLAQGAAAASLKASPWAAGHAEATAQPVSPGLDLSFPALREHRAVLDALSKVSRLLDEAAAASRWRFQAR